MDAESFLARRLDRAAAPLAVGDVLAIVGVLTWGALRHNPAEFLADNPLYLAGIHAPFLIGWVVAAVPIGAYSPGAAESAKASVPLAVRSWIPAALVGAGLRWAGVFHGGATPVFVLVAILTGGVALAVVRTLQFRLF
jgi:hypothetical protein